MEPASPHSQLVPSILVLGSGLGGASAARALAERGFRVKVLDAGTAPAQGASGLPVGLMTPHVSGDDNPLSRLTRAGLRMVLAHAQAHLRAGEDWSPSGLLERRMSGKARRGRWPEAWLSPHPSDTLALIDAAQDWFRPASAAQHLAAGLPVPEQSQADEPKGIWHLRAGWLKPAALVASLLDHPLIEWHGQTTVTRMHAHGQTWWVHDQQGRVHEGQQVVIALGPSSAGLLQALLPQAHWPLEPLRGQVTGGAMPPSGSGRMPSHPVNGLGSFLPGVPMPDGPTWWYGSTYDHSRSEPVCLSQDQDTNMSQLAGLLPLLADTKHTNEAKEAGLLHQGVGTWHAGEANPTTFGASLRNWAGVRCTTHDRLPVVGPLEGAPGVHVLTALGSRGITLGLLCADILASHICGEPLPIDPAVAHLLRPHRFKKSSKSLI
jgi:tRNA 5-methylaminomethyl-2-thiouridine biosynthesis bifunctional protein